jgi:Holliday junction resolvase RusA-like endonuclease
MSHQDNPAQAGFSFADDPDQRDRAAAPEAEPITVIVDGAAVAKGRPRFVRKTGIAFTPPHVRQYEDAARFAASVAMAGRAPIAGPVRLEMVVELAIPASWSKKKHAAALLGEVMPTSRPDIDNYLKSICDALNTIVVVDDSQIVELRARKRYSDQPKLVATVFPLA